MSAMCHFFNDRVDHDDDDDDDIIICDFVPWQVHHWSRNLGPTFKGSTRAFWQKMTPFSITFTTVMLKNPGNSA